VSTPKREKGQCRSARKEKTTTVDYEGRGPTQRMLDKVCRKRAPKEKTQLGSWLGDCKKHKTRKGKNDERDEAGQRDRSGQSKKFDRENLRTQARKRKTPIGHRSKVKKCGVMTE